MLVGNTDEQKIWNYLNSNIRNSYGTAGLMGNLYAESHLSSINLQNTSNKVMNVTDEQYTLFVDNGTYKNFANDSAGYGLAQWTSSGRKKNLFTYIKSKNKSIGDLELQLQFLINELQTDYKNVWSALVSAKSVADATVVVLTKYERPKNQSSEVQFTRVNYAIGYYNKYSSGKEVRLVMDYKRSDAVQLITSWINKKESDGTHKSIIDIYNSQNPLPSGYKMKYTDAWCATTVSAVAIKLGYNSIFPLECSVSRMITKAKSMGIWVENDGYVPLPGDLVCYDWQDNAFYSITDNLGSPDHVGMVVQVNKSAGYFVVVEGNYNDAVKQRTVSINGRYIRGFITPKYTDNNTSIDVTNSSKKSNEVIALEVINDKWGSGHERKVRLKAAGYDYDAIQKIVTEKLNGSAVQPKSDTQDQSQPIGNKVTATARPTSKDTTLEGTYFTTAKLYLRNDAGKNKKAICIIPQNTKVSNYGWYSIADNRKWLWIQVIIDGVLYTGFSSSEYLKKL